MRNQKKGIYTVEDLLRYYDLDSMRAESVLYNNPTGSTGTITLSETSANFEYMDILYRSNDNNHNNVMVYNPNGKNVELCNIMQNATYTYIKSENISISGTTISRGDGRETRLSTTPAIGRWTANWAYIVRVVGYR